jgi:fucose 4-O-acetylase-like acetyltransferase
MLEIAKIIGITLVVLGHVFGSGLFGAKLYHMPLFFFISGFTMKKEEHFNILLWKKIKRLFIPFVIYEIVFVLLNSCFYRIGIISQKLSSGKDYIVALEHIMLFDNYSILLAPIWFSTALFFSSILAYLIIFVVSRIIKKIQIRDYFMLGFSLVLLYAGMILGKNHFFIINSSYNFPQIINVIIEATGYIIMGFVIKSQFDEKKDNILKIKRPTIITSIVLLQILFVSMLVFERKSRLNADMRSNKYDFIMFQPLFAFVGIAEIIIISYFLSKLLDKYKLIKLKKTVLFVGASTFSIMCLHPIAFKLLGIIQVYLLKMDRNKLADWQFVSNNPFWLSIAFFLGLFLPLGFDVIIVLMRKRIKNVNNK